LTLLDIFDEFHPTQAFDIHYLKKRLVNISLALVVELLISFSDNFSLIFFIINDLNSIQVTMKSIKNHTFSKLLKKIFFIDFKDFFFL